MIQTTDYYRVKPVQTDTEAKSATDTIQNTDFASALE